MGARPPLPSIRRGARRRRFVFGLAVAGVVALAVTLVGAALAASSPGLTATAISFAGHPAYLETAVGFSGGPLAANEVRALRLDLAAGRAELLVGDPAASTTVDRRAGSGATVRIARTAEGLKVGISGPAGRFKYLSYTVVGANRLVIDLWSTMFTAAGNISRGENGCLTLSGVRVADGRVTATGTAGPLFEARFRVVVRNALGRVLAARALSRRGRWNVTLRYTAPQGQTGSFEAAADSAKDGALACLVQRALVLPASNARANLRVVHRARADVNGDGRGDLVTLRRTGSSSGRLTVTLAGGGRLSAATRSDAPWLPGLVAAGNVDGRAGAELFVDVLHVTTAESIDVFTDWRGRLLRAGTLSAYGYDYGILYGVTCSSRGSRHLVTEHAFALRFRSNRWTRQDTVYLWRGPRLRLLARRKTVTLRGEPSPALVGVQCGRAPSAAR